MPLTRWDILLSFCQKGCKSGLLAGILWGLLFLFFTSPLIWEAETYEEKGSHHHIQETLHSRNHAVGQFDLKENLKLQLIPTVVGCVLLGGAFGMISSLFLGVGFSFGFLSRNFFQSPIRSAFLTALVGFLIFHGIPSIGNPPERPRGKRKRRKFCLTPTLVDSIRRLFLYRSFNLPYNIFREVRKNR